MNGRGKDAAAGSALRAPTAGGATTTAVLRPVGLAFAAALLGTLLGAVGVVRPLDLLVRDAVLRRLPRREAARVAAVLVDEESLRELGPWPWSRFLLASVVDRVRGAGARGLVVDLLLVEPAPGDDLLAAFLGRVPSVLGVALDDSGRWLLPPRLLLESARAGHVSFETERDGVVRRFLATKDFEGRSLVALPMAGAVLADAARPVPVGEVLRPSFATGPDEVPAWGAARLLAGGVPAGAIEGRIVFLGASAAGVGDRVVTPVARGGEPRPGVLVQAAAAECILGGELVGLLPPVATGAAAGIAAGLALLAFLPARGSSLAPLLRLALALLPLPAGAILLGFARLELASASASLASLTIVGGSSLVEAAGRRRRAGAAARRVQELEALAASMEAGRRDEAEARRVMAHDLRTPLTSVRGLAQLLSGYDLSDEERRRVAGLVASEASRLSGMVDALLDLERLKLRDFGAHARTVPLSELVAGRAALLAAGGGHPLEADVAPGLSVRGDAALLERVVDNLVGNAFKFSPESAAVGVRLARTADGRAGLEVADRGPGVAAPEREAVFRRFARGTGAAGVPGLGLGLALVSEIVDWHGGCVEVGENPGGGSVFRVLLPLLPERPEPVEANR